MSREEEQQLHSSAKRTQQMTRDGLVEHDKATGQTRRISQREEAQRLERTARGKDGRSFSDGNPGDAGSQAKGNRQGREAARRQRQGGAAQKTTPASSAPPEDSANRQAAPPAAPPIQGQERGASGRTRQRPSQDAFREQRQDQPLHSAGGDRGPPGRSARDVPKERPGRDDANRPPGADKPAAAATSPAGKTPKHRKPPGKASAAAHTVRQAGRTAAAVQRTGHTAAPLLSGGREETGQDGAADRSLETGKSALRFTSRTAARGVEHAATRPYRAAGQREVSVLRDRLRFERRAATAQAEAAKTSNPISRFLQRRRLKQKYAAQFRAANKLARTTTSFAAKRQGAKVAASGLSRLVVRVGGGKFLAIALGVLLLIVMGFNACSALSSVFLGVSGTTYVAPEGELLAAEAAYAALETGLQYDLDHYESNHGGYDEYRYHLDPIGHDPHELAAYLTARYVDFTAAALQPELERIFALQYLLSSQADVEIRYRTEEHTSTWTDPETGETHEDSYTVEVPYEYHILTVTLENNGLAHLAQTELSEDQRSLYAMYRLTLGNMPLLFGGGSADASPSVDLSDVVFLQGARPGNQAVVEIALSQVGNVGGQPYWSWYGFSGRVEWCACFVSWCIAQAGDTQPRFSACTSGGMAWFQARGQWADRNYSDIAPGDLIFFDWDGSGNADHVGIVIGTDGSRVYTVEGNSGDACRIRSYPLGSSVIRGYGLLS